MAYWLWSVPPDALVPALRTGTLALRRQGARRLAEIAPGDRIFVYVPGRRVLAAMVEATGAAFEDATAAPDRPGHAPHRLRVRPLIVLPDEARVPYDGFAPHLHVLGEYAHLPTPEARFRAVAQRVVHRLPALDGKVLEFVLRARAGADPEALMAAVEAVREARDEAREHGGSTGATREHAVAEPTAGYALGAAWSPADASERLVAAVEARGFVFEPVEVVGLVVALRTKPFAILSGVTGVGKSRLPVLVAEATGSASGVLPVRPDWTDPAETVGYTDLSGRFRPGAVLRAARAAAADPERAHVLVLDEMNLGRPEHFLAEVLSRMESRRDDGSTEALVSERLGPTDRAWADVGLPPNLLLVGTVNVDEAGHALSARVLDRAFAFDLEASDLAAWRATASGAPAPDVWSAEAWRPLARRLAELKALDAADTAEVERAVSAVAALSGLLAPAGLPLGYRARDEAALFCVHAREVAGTFRTRSGDPVDPLDVALAARVLARLDGALDGRPGPAREAVRRALEWASGAGADDALDRDARPESFPDARFPRLAAGLARALGSADLWA